MATNWSSCSTTKANRSSWRSIRIRDASCGRVRGREIPSGRDDRAVVKTGEPDYQQERLPKPYSFKSSPVAANGKLYLASENEDVIVVKMGEKFEVLATNTLPDEMFIATPAILDGEIYLRGRNTLYCVR